MTIDELKRLRERLNDPSYFVLGIGDLVDACRASIDDMIERKTAVPTWTPAMGTQGTGTPPPSVIYERKTNQGGGGDVGPLATTAAETPHSGEGSIPRSAAAASFDGRVDALIDHFRQSTDSLWQARYQLACRCLRAEDALDSKDAEIERLKSEGVEDLIRQRDEARSEASARAKTITRMAEDGAVGAAECSRHREEIARLKEYGDRVAAELQERSIEAAALGADVRRLTADRDALKAALDEERKACDEWRRCVYGAGTQSCSFDCRIVDDVARAHDARQSASRAKEGGT